MFKYDNNLATNCCLLDYQIIRYSYPSVDVNLSIYSNTDAKFKEMHLNEMYQYYYDTLSEVIRNYGYSVNDFMTLEQYYDSLKLVKVEMIAQVLSINAMLLLSNDIVTKNVQKEDN